MKGEILFEKMTNISDEYVREAALIPGMRRTHRDRHDRPENALTRFMNSGWGVAMLCAVVSLIAVIALARWGQTELPSGFTDRFELSYEISYDDGREWDGHPAPGDTVNVRTCITNLGEAFGTYGFSAHAQFVLQEDSSVLLEGFYPTIDPAWHTVEHGQQGCLTTHFFIPEDAVCGVYDLILSYNGAETVYRGVMTLGEPEETTPPTRNFSFGYELKGVGGTPSHQATVCPGDTFYVDTTVQNNGKPFTYEGASTEFCARAKFVLSGDTETVLTGFMDHTADFDTFRVENGQLGRGSYAFMLPEDTPEGVYDLVLSYGQEKQTFEDVLTVTRIPLSNDSVLHAWTGPYSEEQHVTAVETYAKNYTPVDYGTSLPVTSVIFDAGFEVAECRVVWVGPYEYTAQNEPANAIEKNIRVDTRWWYSDKNDDKLLAYLLCAADTSGGEHYFYFRVLHSAYAPDTQDHILLAWEGKKTDEKLLAAIQEYTANHTPIDYGAYIPVHRVVINTDYAVQSCKLQSVGLLDYEDHEREAKYLVDLYESGIIIPTDHQIIINTSGVINEWSASTAYSYLVQVIGTDGVERYYYFRVDYEPFAGPFDLSYVPLVDSSQHILEAWTGEYSTEKHAAAIEEYVARYTPIEYGPDVPVTSLSFELDFTPAGVSYYRISPAHDVKETDPGYNYLLGLTFQIQGNRFYLKTPRVSSPTSILIGLTDPSGIQHFYYFRIDNSVYQPPAESGT